MTTEPSTLDSSDSAAPALAELVSRVHSLYTLPTVAAEVIQLTSNPKVDAHALKECIQTDPALTVKILRVVNSSLFGLSREVSDLNQALALLGTKPLKLLVLGFSLPENLFREVAQEQLDWFWTNTLTRAVAARAISEKLYEKSGDDAFLAGLLQDIGVLVLLGQLQEPYANFLSNVIRERIDLRRIEVESLGFDHQALTAALLRHWQMPELLVRAIAEPRNCVSLSKQNLPQTELARILHLADLLAELVGQNRLDALPDLLEACDAYCGIDRDCLNELVAYLQPQVTQLAEAMSLQLPVGMDYAAVMSEAHTQMCLLAESVAEPLSRMRTDDEQAYANVLADTAHLRSAMDSFLHQPNVAHASLQESPVSASSEPAAQPNQQTTSPATSRQDNLFRLLTLTVGQCRSQRQPLSLVMLGAIGESALESSGQQVISQLLDAACTVDDVHELIVESRDACQRVLLLPSYDRQQAVCFAQQRIQSLQVMLNRLEAGGTVLDCVLGAGVAAVTLPPKNFAPLDLLETAERCLSAAQAGESFGVKSLEIY